MWQKFLEVGISMYKVGVMGHRGMVDQDCVKAQKNVGTFGKSVSS